MNFPFRPLREPYGTTTPIRLPDDGGASGFYFNHNGVSYLVTNKHVVESDPLCPAEMETYLCDIKPDTARRVSIGDISDRKWYSHPGNNDIDIAIIPLNIQIGALGNSPQWKGPGSRVFTEEHSFLGI